MGSKYRIIWRNYKDRAWHDKQTKWFIVAAVLTVKAVIHYEVVSFEMRKRDTTT